MKRTKLSAMPVVSAFTARTESGQTIRRATRKSERFDLQNYIATFAPPPAELRAMQVTASKTGTSKLTPGQIGRLVSTARKAPKTSFPKRAGK